MRWGLTLATKAPPAHRNKTRRTLRQIIQAPEFALCAFVRADLGALGTRGTLDLDVTLNITTNGAAARFYGDFTLGDPPAATPLFCAATTTSGRGSRESQPDPRLPRRAYLKPNAIRMNRRSQYAGGQ
jgi:hypothetical protein